MKVVIPLAGFGTRLRPHTYTRPKPLMNVAGKPVLGHLLDKLATLDIEEYIFIVGYLGEQVEAYVKTEYKLNARFVEQKEMLGQAHAIWLAREFLDDSPLFIVFVDTLFEGDLTNMYNPNEDALIYVREVEDPRSFGVATLGEGGLITKFVEKPKEMDNRLAVVGLYYFRQSAPLLSAIEQLMSDQKNMLKNEYFLADAMEIMVKSGMKFRTREITAWLDCGKPETVLETNRYLLEHGQDNSANFTNFTNSVIIQPSYIDPSARITNSVIGPHVTIGPNCLIESCHVRNSIIDGSAHCKDTLLEASLVGRAVQLSGHFRMVNIGDSSAVTVI